MNIQHKSRKFLHFLLGLFFFTTTATFAQGVLNEGKNYQVLKTKQPSDYPNKIEVIEFFSFACPHCFSFEPKLEAWIKMQPSDVVVRRIPVSFNPTFAAAQQLFYALEALDKEEALHAKVFEEMHIQHRDLSRPEIMTEFAMQNGIAADQFKAALNSFGVQAHARRATQLSAAYQVDGVPLLVIEGQYATSPSLAGGHEAALGVAQALIDKVRAQRGMSKAMGKHDKK